MSSVIIVFEQRKAFDKVNFEIVPAELKYKGFSDYALGWFRSYSYGGNNRKVRINHLIIQFLKILVCVPQGSRLGLIGISPEAQKRKVKHKRTSINPNMKGI